MEIHAEIEEEIFYPAMEAVPAATKLLGEAHEEHEQVKSLVAAVQSAENAETLVSRIGELREAVLHHATEEEREMFPLAEQLGAGKLDELGQKLQERKQQLKTGLGGAAASHTRGTAQLVDVLVHLAVGVGVGAVYGALVEHGRRPSLAAARCSASPSGPWPSDSSRLGSVSPARPARGRRRKPRSTSPPTSSTGHPSPSSPASSAARLGLVKPFARYGPGSAERVHLSLTDSRADGAGSPARPAGRRQQGPQGQQRDPEDADHRRGELERKKPGDGDRYGRGGPGANRQLQCGNELGETSVMLGR